MRTRILDRNVECRRTEVNWLWQTQDGLIRWTPMKFALKQREHKLEVWKVLLSILTPLVLVALTFVVNNAIQERGALLKREEQILAEKQKIYAELGRG
jgi:type III secretory pathway component EscU